MEQLLNSFKKISKFLLCFVIISTLSFGFVAEQTFAQITTTPTTPNVGNPNAGGTSQAGVYQGNANPSANQTGTLVEDALGGATSCLATQYVSGLISQAIGQLIPSKFYKVGTIDGNTQGKTGGLELADPPSLDSIGYCVINVMIESLANATIEWINTGFDGNPAFLSNPEQFFSDLADQEAAGFIQDVAMGTLGVDVCQPFRVEIATGLANNHNARFGNGGNACTLGQIGQSAEAFDVYTSGQSPDSGNLSNWFNMTQNSQNNRFGAYLQSQDELQKRISMKENNARIDISNGSGFLSIQKCAPDTTTTGPNGEPNYPVKGACQVTTPGKIIEDQANATLRAGKDRLVLADKFDQVVDALVNQLIKTALDQVLNQESN